MYINKDKKYIFRRIAIGIILVCVMAGIAGITYNREVSARERKEKKELQLKKIEADKLKQQEEEKAKEAKEAEELKLAEEKKFDAAVAGQGKSTPVHILMYHAIETRKGDELFIPKDKFREEMKYIKDQGFNTISLDELYSNIVDDKPLPENPVLITIDDGYENSYNNAFPVLKEFGFKACVFMITSFIDKVPCLHADEMREMEKSGVTIESHTVSHRKLSELSYDEQKTELKDSKEALEKVLGRKVNYLAYPSGKFNNDTLALDKELGYTMALSTVDGVADKSNGIYKLKRIYVSDNYSVDYFKTLLKKK